MLLNVGCSRTKIRRKAGVHFELVELRRRFVVGRGRSIVGVGVSEAVLSGEGGIDVPLGVVHGSFIVTIAGRFFLGPLVRILSAAPFDESGVLAELWRSHSNLRL